MCTLTQLTVQQTRHSSSSPLLDFAASLPPTSSAHVEYSLLDLMNDLTSLATRNLTTNRIFIPALNLVGSLMDAGCLEGFSDVEEGAERYARVHWSLAFTLKLTFGCFASLRQLILLCTRGLAQIKSAPRLTATVKM